MPLPVLLARPFRSREGPTAHLARHGIAGVIASSTACSFARAVRARSTCRILRKKIHHPIDSKSDLHLRHPQRSHHSYLPPMSPQSHRMYCSGGEKHADIYPIDNTVPIHIRAKRRRPQLLDEVRYLAPGKVDVSASEKVTESVPS